MICCSSHNSVNWAYRSGGVTPLFHCLRWRMSWCRRLGSVWFLISHVSKVLIDLSHNSIEGGSWHAITWSAVSSSSHRGHFEQVRKPQRTILSLVGALSERSFVIKIDCRFCVPFAAIAIVSQLISNSDSSVVFPVFLQCSLSWGSCTQRRTWRSKSWINGRPFALKVHIRDVRGFGIGLLGGLLASSLATRSQRIFICVIRLSWRKGVILSWWPRIQCFCSVIGTFLNQSVRRNTMP